MQLWSNDLIDRTVSGSSFDIEISDPTQCFGIIKIARETLTERQLQVFQCRYMGRGLTMEETGVRLDISSVAVLKLERRLIARLQKELGYLCHNDK